MNGNGQESDWQVTQRAFDAQLRLARSPAIRSTTIVTLRPQ
jgi:hypothetical protein